MVRCRNCGRECVLRSSKSLMVAEDTFQTSREYKCPKCKKVYTVTDDPVKIVKERLLFSVYTVLSIKDQMNLAEKIKTFITSKK